MWVEKDTKDKTVTPQPVPHIAKISCGPNHTVAVTNENKVYSWGFGGYGRLGHSETADELVWLFMEILYFANQLPLRCQG